TVGDVAAAFDSAGPLGEVALAENPLGAGACADQVETFSGETPDPGREAEAGTRLAVVAPWPAQPRPVIAAVAPPGLHEAGAMLAEGRGWDPTVGEITDVLLADLDGDGMAEEIATFEHVPPTQLRPQPGSYSIVF